MIKLTLKDIANHFSVSISTVSKALHDSHEISDKLKNKIQEFAKENNYRPNKVALNLVNRSTKSIGVVIPDILNYFFIQVLYGVEKVANERGYSIISCVTDHSLKKETMTLEMLSSGSVDGLIISSVASERQTSKHIGNVKSIVDYQIPLVMFDRVLDDIECDKVIVDDFEAGFKATKYLLETECKTIAIITPIHKTKIGRLRIGGYKRALKERGIPFDDKLIVPIGAKDDLDFILSFILNDKNIDGILVLDEITTVKTMAIIKARGYHVPNDIAIIGFTNGQLSRYVTPALTMVSQHGAYIGETCAHQLIDRIESLSSPGNFETKVVKTSLIVRDSTRKIPLG